MKICLLIQIDFCLSSVVYFHITFISFIIRDRCTDMNCNCILLFCLFEACLFETKDNKWNRMANKQDRNKQWVKDDFEISMKVYMYIHF